MKNKKKKISFVIGSLSSGGAERVISTLSNELINDFDVIIITFETRVPFYKLNERIKVVSCMDGIQNPTSIFQSLILNYRLTRCVSRIIRKEKIDLVIGFITSANIIAIIASKFNRIPSIISERNNPLRTDIPKLWILMKKLIYPLADRLVLQTNGVKKLFENKIRPEKMVILPNPIASELSILRNNSVEKEKIILTVGRLTDNKCHGMLIEVFNEMHTEGWKVIIIGDGNRKEYLNTLIEINNQQNKISIISQVKNIEYYYNKASIFVFTSQTEGFPNALLEAMHFGMPVISTDCDFGPSDLIVDGYNGYLTQVNDKIELKKKLTLLMNDEGLQKLFSQRAKLSTEDYSIDKVILKWKKIIHPLLR